MTAWMRYPIDLTRVVIAAWLRRVADRLDGADR